MLKNFRKVSHSFLRSIKKDCAKIAFPAVYTEETFWVTFLGDIFIIVESGNLLIQCLGDFFYLVKMFETILLSKRLNHSVNVKEYDFHIIHGYALLANITYSVLNTNKENAFLAKRRQHLSSNGYASAEETFNASLKISRFLMWRACNSQIFM